MSSFPLLSSSWARLLLVSARRGPVGAGPLTRTAPGGPGLDQRRHKGNIMRHRKPRWIPLAESTLLSPPPRDFSPTSEVEQCNALHFEYHQHLSAISQYLYEEHLKQSDVGEAAAREAEREHREHERLLKENEEENSRVARSREDRLKREMEDKEREVHNRLEEKRRQEEAEKEAVREEIRYF